MHAVDVFPLWLFHEPLVDLPFTVISQFCFIITRAVVCYSSASDVTLKDTCSRDNGTRESANRACIRCIVVYIDGLVQDCSNSIANAMELLPSYTKPLISCLGNKKIFHRKLFNIVIYADDFCCALFCFGHIIMHCGFMCFFQG